MKNNIKLATVISYITLVSGNLISIIYTPFMLTQLGSAEYGLFSLVNTIISYIYLLDMGLSNAVIRYNSKYIAENNKEEMEKVNGMFLTLYSSISVIGIIIGIIICFNINNIFSNGLSINEMQQMKYMIIVAIVNLAFAFPFNVFNGIITANEKFVFIKLLTFVRTILNPIIMVVILFSGYKALGMLVGSTIFNISLGMVNIVYCFKKLNLRIKFNFRDSRLYKEVFKYSFFIFLSAIAYKIYWSTDQIILGMCVSSTAIAIYSVGLQFNTYFVSFSNVISGMFLPKLTKMVVNEVSKNELMNVLIKVSRIQFYIASFILCGFILVGKQFIMRWAGNDYEYSYYIALLVMIPQLISIIQTLFATMVEAMNMHRVKAYIYLGVSIINLVLTLYFVNLFGTVGCALGTAIGMVINAVLNNIYYSYKIKLDMKFYWIKISTLILPAAISMGIGYGAVYLINPKSYITIAISGILFSLIYFSIFWFFAFNEYEKGMFKTLVNKIMKFILLKKKTSYS